MFSLALIVFIALIALALLGFGVRALLIGNNSGDGGVGIVVAGCACVILGFALFMAAVFWLIFG